MKDEKAEILPHSFDTEISRNPGWSCRVGNVKQGESWEVKNQVKCGPSLEFPEIETELTEPASCCLLGMELIYLRSIQSWPIIIRAKKKKNFP